MNKSTFIKTIKAIQRFNKYVSLLEDKISEYNYDEITNSFDIILTVLFEDVEKLNTHKKALLFDYIFGIDKTIESDNELYEKLYLDE